MPPLLRITVRFSLLTVQIIWKMSTTSRALTELFDFISSLIQCTRLTEIKSNEMVQFTHGLSLQTDSIQSGLQTHVLILLAYSINDSKIQFINVYSKKYNLIFH